MVTSNSRNSKLEALYDALLEEMEDRLSNGDETYDSRSGDHIRTKASAATLRVVAAFLKDQGIEATADNHQLQALADLLQKGKDALKEDDMELYH